MEERLDYADHSSDDNQISSSEEKPSSSLVLLQEQRLFRRIMWLTSLRGITIGICLILFGENWYLLAGYIPHAFYPTSPVIYRLLGPLMTASMGFVLIFGGRLQQLRKQHPIFQPGRLDRSNNSSSWISGEGLFFVLAGGLGVLVILLDSGAPWENVILLLYIVGSIISLIAIWLIPFLKSRHRV